MRDINRIDGVLEVVEYYWKKNPDLRLGQLLLNVARDPRLYYMEDDVLKLSLVAVYERMENGLEEANERVKAWTGQPIRFVGDQESRDHHDTEEEAADDYEYEFTDYNIYCDDEDEGDDDDED